MSSTRRVKPGERRSQNGWASAVEFEELRGLNGNRVADKVALLAGLSDEEKKARLLFFLQALSLREGGTRRIARELLEMFPQRIGTPTMVEIGCRPGKRLTQAERDTIDEELHYAYSRAIDQVFGTKPAEVRHCKTTADEFYAECLEQLESNLDQFIERLCCDPRLAVTQDKDEEFQYGKLLRIIFEGTERESEGRSTEIAKLKHFQEILPTLFEYQERMENVVRESFVETSVGCTVFEALDYALETGRSVLIEGNSGIGKTTAIKAWCQIHSCRARHVQLKGITHRTGFFQEVSRALGVGRGGTTSASKIQTRIEQFLRRTKIMLVIDEGQYLLPPGNRVGTPPELINWLNTACYNEGVPFVISATSEFSDRRAIVEKNTTWQSEQLRRRIRRYFALPSCPTDDDLQKVARKLLPRANPAMLDYVVGYAVSSKGFFQAITNAIEDAHLIASKAGRDEIKFSDMRAAIVDWRSPSDAALGRVFAAKPEPRRRRQSVGVEPQMETDSMDVKEPLNRLSGPINPPVHREISPVPA